MLQFVKKPNDTQNLSTKIPLPFLIYVVDSSDAYFYSAIEQNMNMLESEIQKLEF